MIRDKTGLINKLREMTGCLVCNKDIMQDELKKYPSFFVYETDGEIERANSGVEMYNVKFYLNYVTTENKQINPFEIIDLFEEHALIFERTERSVGKLQQQDKEALMITFICHHIERGRC